MSVLKADHIGIQFGGLRAVDDFCLDLKGHEIYAIIGPNGAGKTTVFNILTGIYQPTTGHVEVNGKPMDGCKPYQFTAVGLARTFQNIRLFDKATVLDNVKMAHTLGTHYSFANMLFRNGSYHSEEKRVIEESEKLLKMFDLDDKKNMFAKNLPYGEQRKLEIVRALATEPQILLLDEPAAGMNPSEIEDILTLIKRVRDELGKTILMIEHHMNLVMAIAEYIKVLDFGVTISEGKPDMVKNDPRVIEAYLGGSFNENA
jgi:branched-chain amino acid transport system ATP-binding protein